MCRRRVDGAAGRRFRRRGSRGARSAARGLCDGSDIRFFAEPEFDFLELVAGEVAILPLVIVHRTVPDVCICTMGFNITVPPIGLENGDNVDRVRGGQGSVAFDDDEIIVIFAGTL